jgi:predicted RNase H-like nuclease (RuvC/YqgF family)
MPETAPLPRNTPMDGNEMTIPWLKELEERVQDTSSRLSELKKENTALKARIESLESELAAAPGADEKAVWTEEKSEIRTRVESLAEHLEALLKD